MIMIREEIREIEARRNTVAQMQHERKETWRNNHVGRKNLWKHEQTMLDFLEAP